MYPDPIGTPKPQTTVLNRMSQAISVTLPHELGRAEARRRIDEGFADVSRRLGVGAGMLSKSWQGDRLNFALSAVGQSLSGLVEVEERLVRIELTLPGLLGVIADKVRGRLQREGQLLLDKK